MLPPTTLIGGSQGTGPAVVDELEAWSSYIPDTMVCALAMGNWDGVTCN
jgi:hypothetical protein